MAEIDKYLRLMVEHKTSDLHLCTACKPMYRKDGAIVPLRSEAPLTPERMEQLLFEIAPPDKLEEFKRCNDTDFAYELPGCGRFRANYFRDHKGIGGVFRLIPAEVITFDELKLPPVLKKFCELSKGLVLVTGPTGSGKSTTLAAMIDHINKTRSEHIITIEDPIEFVHQNQRCLINQRQVHHHTASFKAALRAALREDPDIVLVGEMRDLETIDAAITAAETGHLVFGTLHTTGAAKTIDRVVNAFPTNQQEQIRIQLSTVLQAVISQLLLPRIDKPGRVAIFEIMVNTPSIAALIRDNKTFRIQSDIQTGAKYGMVTLDSFLLDKYMAGMIAREEVITKAQDPVTIQAKLQELELAEAVGADASAMVEGKV